MSKLIEDYALIGNCRTAALVARDGSIDWLCLPRFDAEACFSALLGTEKHGMWSLRPVQGIENTERKYLENTLVLQTTFSSDEGEAVLTEFMPPNTDVPMVVRTLRGVRGTVRFECVFRPRMDYGFVKPMMRQHGQTFEAIGGPQTLFLQSDVAGLQCLESSEVCGEFEISKGEKKSFLLWAEPSHCELGKECEPPSKYKLHPEKSLTETKEWWQSWLSKNTYNGPYKEDVERSLLVIRSLTYAPTGGIVAAPTTSLPEDPGGVRNWDYRFCWIRDASLVLVALFRCGFLDEAKHWHDWLMRATAGNSKHLQIMYGIGCERRLSEAKLDWLPGYENSSPVRTGNEAYEQFQLDIYGEIVNVHYLLRKNGVKMDVSDWNFICALVKDLETGWKEEDEGIWEVRSKKNQFTYSKFMAWVAFDKAIKCAEEFGLDAPDLGKWKQVRDDIKEAILTRAYNPQRKAFMQAYDSEYLDASVLRMPLEGFIDVNDERMQGTIKAIEEHLLGKEFVFRYYPSHEVDGLPGHEGAFIMCNFWLVENYIHMGEHEKARAFFERLLSLGNDLRLFSEEYEPTEKRLIGNFPQGLSHIALINAAWTFEEFGRPGNSVH